MLRTIFLFLFCTQVTLAADEIWQMKRDRDEIQVYTRAVEGSKHRAVKSTMTVSAELGELVAIIRDVTICPEWAAFCRYSELLMTISESELIVYTYNDIPWPAADRDAVTKVLWNQSNGGTVTMTATIIDYDRPSIPRVVRLVDGTTSWKLSPLDDGRIYVESEAHINPRGRTPAWLTNKLLVDAPFDTMVGMRKLLKTGRFQGFHFDFLAEQ